MVGFLHRYILHICSESEQGLSVRRRPYFWLLDLAPTGRAWPLQPTWISRLADVTSKSCYSLVHDHSSSADGTPKNSCHNRENCQMAAWKGFLYLLWVAQKEKFNSAGSDSITMTGICQILRCFPFSAFFFSLEPSNQLNQSRIIIFFLPKACNVPFELTTTTKPPTNSVYHMKVLIGCI